MAIYCYKHPQPVEITLRQGCPQCRREKREKRWL